MATTAARIIEEAKRLSARERRKVVAALEASVRRSARRPGPATGDSPCRSLLAIAGTARSEATHISSDKYTHLASVYSDDE